MTETHNSIIYRVLNEAIERKASDIHLTDRIKPTLRIDGYLIQLNEYEVNTPDILSACVKDILTEENIEKYEKEKNVDVSIQYGGSRFRVHIYKQRGCDAFSLRLIPTQIPQLSDLLLPPVLRKFTTLKNGLVLVTGVTGSGKSTTLASLIDEINKNYNKHIITVEDPIEFIHEHNKCIVNQREVGVDVLNFGEAVRAAMREDPDILLLGEMRDNETISNAITMAETGHLVFATLHTKSVAESVDRIIDVFPPEQQEQVRIQLANSLQGIVSQELIPKSDGGRVVCCEVMVVNDSLRNMIRSQALPNAINDQLAMFNKKLGSQTRIQALVDLIKKDLITKEIAIESTIGEAREDLIKSIKYIG